MFIGLDVHFWKWGWWWGGEYNVSRHHGKTSVLVVAPVGSRWYRFGAVLFLRIEGSWGDTQRLERIIFWKWGPRNMYVRVMYIKYRQWLFWRFETALWVWEAANVCLLCGRGTLGPVFLKLKCLILLYTYCDTSVPLLLQNHTLRKLLIF